MYLVTKETRSNDSFHRLSTRLYTFSSPGGSNMALSLGTGKVKGIKIAAERKVYKTKPQ